MAFLLRTSLSCCKRLQRSRVSWKWGIATSKIGFPSSQWKSSLASLMMARSTLWQQPSQIIT